MTYRIIIPVSGTGKRLAHHIKNLNVKLKHFANADAAANAYANADANANTNANAGGSTIALPGLRPGELRTVKRCTKIEFSSIFYKALPKLTIIASTHIGYLDDLISSYASFF